MSTGCRYPLGDETSSALDLPNGRKLGYAQFGSKTGQPIFYCHGMPGARKEGAYFDALAKKHGARIIAVERPGYGLSTPQLNRKILDYPKDVELLANHLELASYGIIGISGGGPYVLACAYALPAEKLKAATIVCGVGTNDMGFQGVDWGHWAGGTFGWRWLDWLLPWWLRNEPGAKLDLSDEQRLDLLRKVIDDGKARARPVDLPWMNDTDRLVLSLQNQREAYKQGWDAFKQDGRLIYSDWGFKLEDIRHDLPVHLWYGKFDEFVPSHHGEQIARRLGLNATLRMGHDTHTSIAMNNEEKILKDLLRSMDGDE